MGSARFAEDLGRILVVVDLMIALYMFGYYSDRPGSQSFPFPGFGALYPRSGDFAAIVGDLGAGAAIRRVKRGMHAARAIPVRSFRAPSFVEGVHWSDHVSFRRRGIPAVLVTDTAFLRNPNYHTRNDTPDTLDYRAMGEVVRGLYGVLKVEEPGKD
jgi:Zn-dependent M28 family amino/carboxypeptidase